MGQALRRASGRLPSSAVDKSPPPHFNKTVGPTPPAVPFDKVSADTPVPDSSKYVCLCKSIIQHENFINLLRYYLEIFLLWS